RSSFKKLNSNTLHIHTLLDSLLFFLPLCHCYSISTLSYLRIILYSHIHNFSLLGSQPTRQLRHFSVKGA
ncbi:hypothetical protein KSS87_009585, partial [Heliosperma pusillum]